MKRILLSLLLAFGPAPVAQAQERTTVFAAASLSGPLQELGAGLDVAFSFAGSGTIARQLAAGAPADVVILANAAWMAWLTQNGHVTAGATHIIAQNRLVVVARAGTPLTRTPEKLIAVLGNDHLAMGQRDAVPAGSYAQQWMRSAGIWDSLQTRLAETDNVRAALALVSRGDAPLGVVYASDAVAEPAVAVIYAIPPDSHDAIVYPAAALAPAGQRFVDLIRSSKGQQVLAKHGFGAAP